MHSLKGTIVTLSNNIAQAPHKNVPNESCKRL